MAHMEIGIIGAGVSGLCAAIQLKRQLGIDTFTIFDENEDVGGTWLVNRYPGCACDVPSHLYSFSFEPNPYWSKAYSGQEEIWEYLRGVARKHDLYPKIKFHHKVREARWDEAIAKWKVTVLNSQDGTESRHVFDLLVSGTGALRIPNYPTQFEPFSGPKTHSAEWDSLIQLKDKVVAIVGSGASAVQIIPEIVDKVERLIVYQRKPAWVTPRTQVAFPAAMQWAFAHLPGAQWALRSLIFWSWELTHSGFKAGSLMNKLVTKLGHYQLGRQIEDPELRRKLTPEYTIGCKRITPSNDYYPALAKRNVRVITSPITEVTKDSIVNEDGTREKPDVLILATGYKAQELFAPAKIVGKGGADLLQKWKQSDPCTYGGITCHHVPNAFFLLGPNTALGHNSVIFSIECQVNWMIEAVKEMRRRNARTITVKKSAEDEYMHSLQEKMKGTVWGTTECGSWYANERGVNTVLWPDNLVAYYNFTKSLDPTHFDFE